VQLGQLVGAPPLRLASYGLAAAEHEPYRALLHFMDVRGKPLQA
jgi:hypothetical protein